jgi:hypothetical protein
MATRWGKSLMYQPRNFAEWGIPAAALALFAITVIWIGYGGSEPHVAQDYEDCAANAQAAASSKAEYNTLLTRCSERFAARRKPNGGYTYFDFMQNRNFDIAGPNPTEDERKKIDHAYMEFLGAQRREMFLSELAKAQANQADLRPGRQDGGGPLDLTARIPLPAKRPFAQRVKSCNDGSLSCSWAKLTAAVKNAFASSAGKNP